MGQEIASTSFNKEQEESFKQKLCEETAYLKELFDSNAFESQDIPSCGMELEGWLVQDNFRPAPIAERFITELGNEQVVPEIAQFNFEINTLPMKFSGNVLSRYHQQLEHTWRSCQKKAGNLGHKAMMIGSLPTLKKEMLTLDYIYPNQRYLALNNRIMSLIKHAPSFPVDIFGEEGLREQFNSIMVESAATSLQLHLQVKQSEAVDIYNASVLLSPFMSAICANSPYLLGKALWSDTRIAIFEEAVRMLGYETSSSNSGRERVSLGKNYVYQDIFELFKDNLSGYPILLPELFDKKVEDMAHLKFHNGTIWRWNRPIIGKNENGKPHIRIEHRVPASGPTPSDTIANMAFYLGAVYALIKDKDFKESMIPFTRAKDNFYRACKEGYGATIFWKKQQRNLQQVLILDLLPKVEKTLLEMGLDQNDINYYVGDILKNRIAAGQNASNWQKSFVENKGKHFQDLLEIYYNYQERDLPVHRWVI